MLTIKIAWNSDNRSIYGMTNLIGGHDFKTIIIHRTIRKLCIRIFNFNRVLISGNKQYKRYNVL